MNNTLKKLGPIAMILIITFAMTALSLTGCGKDAITYTATANNATATTAITLAFSASVTDLTASDITVANGTGSVTKETLTGSGTSWSLGITVIAAGTITVSIAKSGIKSGANTVTVAKGSGDGTTSIVRERLNVDYAPNGERRHARQRFDLRLPDTGEGPFPLLIYVHGGGFSGGNWQLSQNNNGLVSLARSRGYAVASVGYLLMGQSGWQGGQRVFPENVEDILAAIRHLRANAAEYRLDSNRFAISGFSAGAYMTAIVCALSNATDHGFDITTLGNAGVSHAVQAAACTAALTDFALLNTHQSANNGIAYFMDHDAGPAGVMLGGNLKNDKDKEPMKTYLRMQNPLTYISAATPPIYMLHGTSDNLVPWQQSEIMVNKVNEFDPGKAVFNKVSGRGHADFDGASDSITVAILNFLDEKLGIQR